VAAKGVKLDDLMTVFTGTHGLANGLYAVLDAAKAAAKPSRLIPIPSSLLMFAATLLGKKAVAQRLVGSLQVDISKARDLLGWEPPISVEEGLRRCFSRY